MSPDRPLDRLPASPPQGGVVNSLVAAPASPQYANPNPVSIVSPPLDETPIATKVPAEAASGGGAAAAPLANPVPLVTSGASGVAKTSLDGVSPTAPASGVTQPTLGGFNAPQDETPTNDAPIPPARPAEATASDSPGTEKASVRTRGQLSKHRREASSPDAVAGTIGSAGTDRRSGQLTLRKHTKPASASATRAGNDLRNAVEPPGAPEASGQPGDPLPLGGSVSPAAIGSVEAPAPAQQLTGHSTTR